MAKRPRVEDDSLALFRGIVGESVPDSVLQDCLRSSENNLERAVDRYFASLTVPSVAVLLEPARVPLLVQTCIPLGSLNCLGGLTTKLSAAANELYMDTPLNCVLSIRSPTSAPPASTPSHLVDLIHGSGFVRFSLPGRSDIGRLPAPIAAAICPLVRLGLVEISVSVGYPGCAGLHLDPGASVPIRIDLFLPPAAMMNNNATPTDDLLNERIHAAWMVLIQKLDPYVDPPNVVDLHVPDPAGEEILDIVDVGLPAPVDVDLPDRVDVNILDPVEADLPNQVDVDLSDNVYPDLPDDVDSLNHVDLDLPDDVHVDSVNHVDLDLPDDVDMDHPNHVHRVIECTESSVRDLGDPLECGVDDLGEQAVSAEMAQFSNMYFSNSNLPEIYPAPGVIATTLKPYQAQALGWMVARESDTEGSSDDGWIKVSPSLFYHEGRFSQTRLVQSNCCRGGILADEMGLGKTVMTLALIAYNPVGATLVIVHLSILRQWICELKRHCPRLTYVEYHGTGRLSVPESQLRAADVVFSTYGTVAVNIEDSPLLKIEWGRIVLDEAHSIRTRSTKMSKAVGRLAAQCRWCLTGTPIQNSVEDIYPLLAWLRVSRWKSFAFFKSQILGVPNGLENAQKMLKPLMLRRTKDTRNAHGEPLVQLPPRVNKIIQIELAPEEKDFYRALFWQTKLEFDKFEKSNQVMYNMTHILQLLMRLRQALCHPFLCKTALLADAQSEESVPLQDLLEKFAQNAKPCAYIADVIENLNQPGKIQNLDCPICLDDPCQFPVLTPCGHTMCRKCCVGRLRGECPICRHVFANTQLTKLTVSGESSPPLSSKLRVLLEHVHGDMHANRRVIVFSQFVAFLNLIGQVFSEAQIPFNTLHGAHSPNEREAAVEWLGESGPPRVLLVSLKAGGVGLNLVAASVVYLTDLWWNPAVEEQAFQRVHRLGQMNPEVKTFKLVCTDTIDERILDLQATKSQITNDVLGDTKTDNTTGLSGSSRKLSLQDIRQLFKPQ